MKVEFVINDSELGAGTRGASLGYEAVKVASWKEQKTVFSQYKHHYIETYNHELEGDDETPNAQRISGILKVYKNLVKQIPPLLKENTFPFIIAGDHASAGGTIAAIKSCYPNEEIGVVWIDAHADLHTPSSSPSGNVHGMPLGSALGLKDNGPKQLSELEKKSWDELIEVGGISPKVVGRNVKFVAVRSIEKEEIATLKQHDMRNFEVSEVRQNGAEAVAQEILSELSHCTKIYISFDVDSMDSDVVSEGTGTPVLNGLFPEEACDLLTTLLSDERCCCLEFVEINPCLDNKRNVMAETAFELIESCLAVLKTK